MNVNYQEYVAIIISVGTLLPLLTSVLQRPSFSDRTRTLIGVGLSIVSGLVVYVSTNGLDLSNPSAIVAAVVGVTLAAGAAYKTIWKTSGVAPAIEVATSPKEDHPDELKPEDTVEDH